MKEEFLHWLWKNRYFDASQLFDKDSGVIEVLSPGEYNTDSGPDFFNTRLSISGTHWAGNTEIHLTSSDWFRHGHHTDHAYDNVILHLVYKNDAEVYTASGRKLITIELRFDNNLWDNYLTLVNSPMIIACSKYIRQIDQFYMHHWLWSLTITRLERKSADIEIILTRTGNDWEETLYRLVSRYFGFRVNTDPFEMLASRLPLKVIRRHADNLLQVESLLFGTAGLLDQALFKETVTDEYYSLLCREYRTLSSKYSLEPLDGWIWKFHRLRPANFPTLRIAQLAILLASGDGLFSRVLDCKNSDELRNLFSVSASEYWDTHYNFGTTCKKQQKHAGRQSIDLLLINALVPLLFVYGKLKGINEKCVLATDILESIPPEDNHLIDDYINAGLIPESAFTTQALIELRNHYCRSHMCLECHIGAKLIASGREICRSDSLFLEP
jgi:hypothetical protein